MNFSPKILAQQFMRQREVATPEQQLQTRAMIKDSLSKADLLGYLPMGRARSAYRIIHPEDRQAMMKIIDYVRLKQPMNHALELDASRIGEHYGIPMGKTLNGVANNFERTLDSFKQRNYPSWKKMISEGIRNFGE